MELEKVKITLADVFDDKRHTKVWHGLVDWSIILLIIISSLEVFLSTFEDIHERFGGLLQFIDVFTTIVFTIEVSFRIWVADLIDPKYVGFRGRLKYCTSFYGLVDFISTYPSFLSIFLPIPVSALKIIRVTRLFRIFRYLKSFQILGKAISSKKEELSVSMVFLVIITLILSFLLYFAEHDAQPELCENGWQTIVWAFAKYLGDPGKIADFPLVTFWGQFIAALVGILGIAIFAVPAGLISSGFLEVIGQQRNLDIIVANQERIRHSFRWVKDQQYTNLFHVPAFQPIDYLLVKQYITAEEVVDAVKNSHNYHLYNLAKAFDASDQVADRVVVVACQSNRPYGVCIDRGSNVTIVSTSSYEEPITGWVAYHVAKLGGFNYVSKDVPMDLDVPVSFYNITDPKANKNLELYLEDIGRLSNKPASWVIPMCFCTGPKSREHTVHLCYSPVKNDSGYENPKKTFEDIESFDSFSKELSSVLDTILR